VANRSINTGDKSVSQTTKNQLSPTGKISPKNFKKFIDKDNNSSIIMSECSNLNLCSDAGNASEILDAMVIPPNVFGPVSSEISNFRQTNVPTRFPANYLGVITVLIFSINKGNNLGKLHPVSIGKFLTKKFEGVIFIIPAGLQQIMINFNSIKNANTCILSPVLEINGLVANILNLLLYCFGVIRLDVNVMEEDFWDGHESPVEIISFRRINIRRNGAYVPSQLVALKFLAAKLPDKINIFKMLFNVLPSIRSPTRYNNCLRFGYIHKCCCCKQRCEHCGMIRESSAPKCVNCIQLHLSTDRFCKGWVLQKEN